MELESRWHFLGFIVVILGLIAGAFLAGLEHEQYKDLLEKQKQELEKRMDYLQLPRTERKHGNFGEDRPPTPEEKWYWKDYEFPDNIIIEDGPDSTFSPDPAIKKGSQRGSLDIFRLVGFSQAVPRRKDWPGWKQAMVRYAHRLGGSEFVLTLTAENPQWDIRAVGKNTNGTTDHGLCQLNSRYHWEFISSPSFKYWDKQLEYCATIWHDARKRGILDTTFYGSNRMHEFVNAFDWSPKKRKG